MDFFKFGISENLMILNVKIADVYNVMAKGPVGTYRRLEELTGSLPAVATEKINIF
jgi:hypothetical protein